MHRETETLMISHPMADGDHPQDGDSFSLSYGRLTRTTTGAADTAASSPERDPGSPATTATTTTRTIDAPPSPGKPLLPVPPGTYVIQIPKDQVYRVPPPENAKRFEYLSGRKPQRSRRCRSCLCLSLAILVLLILLAGISAASLYLVFRPKSPNYSIESISIKGFNLTSSSPMSPEFDVSVRADNPNDKIGIYYRTGSSVNVYYDDVGLASGSLPALYQGPNNVTVFETTLKGSGIEFTAAARNALVDGIKKGTVPFRLDLRAPVKIKIGAVKTWTITVKVKCDVTVNKLTADAKVVSKNCRYGVKLW